MADQITLTRPDDWHVHLRDGEALKTVVPHTAAQFARAIVMPNLRPPITTAAQAVAYRERILAAVPKGVRFDPLMTLYLTDKLPPDEVKRAKDAGVVAVKLYPAGATTNSDAGVTDLRKTYKALEAMQREGLLLLVHGEVTSPEVDLFDREAVFIDTQLVPLRRDFPRLKVVMEHITTREAAQYVHGSDAFMAATITAHHLLYNRNAIFTGGIRPHYYCLPVLKREVHRVALVEAATCGSSKFFLGTDSAPHPRDAKESGCGCAGIFNAPFALESYASAFEEEGALDRFEAFASLNGARFYGLEPNPGTVTLERAEVEVPERLQQGGIELVPFHAGQTLRWRFVG
jgi:dihydroorotase